MLTLLLFLGLTAAVDFESKLGRLVSSAIGSRMRSLPTWQEVSNRGEAVFVNLGWPTETREIIKLDGHSLCRTMELRKLLHEFGIFSGAVSGLQSSDFSDKGKTAVIDAIDSEVQFWKEISEKPGFEALKTGVTDFMKEMANVRLLVMRAKPGRLNSIWRNDFIRLSATVLDLIEALVSKLRVLTEMSLSVYFQGVEGNHGQAELLTDVIRQLIKQELVMLQYDGRLLNMLSRFNYVNMRPIIALSHVIEILQAVVNGIVVDMPLIKDIWSRYQQHYSRGKGLKEKLLSGSDSRHDWIRLCQKWRRDQIAQIEVLSELLFLL